MIISGSLLAGNEPSKIFTASLLGGASHPRHVLCQTALVELGLVEPSSSSPKGSLIGVVSWGQKPNPSIPLIDSENFKIYVFKLNE